MNKISTRRNRTRALIRKQGAKPSCQVRIDELINASDIDVIRAKATSQQTEYQIAVTKIILDEYGEFYGHLTTLARKLNKHHATISYYKKFAKNPDRNILEKVKEII